MNYDGGPAWELNTCVMSLDYAQLMIPGGPGPIPAAPVEFSADSLVLAVPAATMPWLPAFMVAVADRATGEPSASGEQICVAIFRCAASSAFFLVDSDATPWEPTAPGAIPSASGLDELLPRVPETFRGPGHPFDIDCSQSLPPSAVAVSPTDLDRLLGGGLAGGPWGGYMFARWPPEEPAAETSAAEDQAGEPAAERIAHSQGVQASADLGGQPLLGAGRGRPVVGGSAARDAAPPGMPAAGRGAGTTGRSRPRAATPRGSRGGGGAGAHAPGIDQAALVEMLSSTLESKIADAMRPLHQRLDRMDGGGGEGMPRQPQPTATFGAPLFGVPAPAGNPAPALPAWACGGAPPFARVDPMAAGWQAPPKSYPPPRGAVAPFVAPSAGATGAVAYPTSSVPQAPPTADAALRPAAYPAPPAPPGLDAHLPPAAARSHARGAGGDARMDALMDAMTQQADATRALLVHQSQQPRGGAGEINADPMSMLAGGPLEDLGMSRSPGARGAASQEMLRRKFEANTGLYSRMVRGAIVRVLSGKSTSSDPRLASAWEFVCEEVPLGNMKTLTFFMFGLAIAFDQMRDGLWAEAEDTVARLLVGGEQSAIDEGKWPLAWMLTHLVDPPWSRVQTQRRGETRPFGRLSDPSMVASAIAYMKDLASLEEIRKKQKSFPPPGGDGPNPKKKGAGKGGGAASTDDAQ